MNIYLIKTGDKYIHVYLLLTNKFIYSYIKTGIIMYNTNNFSVIKEDLSKFIYLRNCYPLYQLRLI